MLPAFSARYVTIAAENTVEVITIATRDRAGTIVLHHLTWTTMEKPAKATIHAANTVSSIAGATTTLAVGATVATLRGSSHDTRLDTRNCA